jgi:hypothetical protein
MDLHKMISELQAERQRLDEAIQALERLSAGSQRRRGRPPRWSASELGRQENAPSDAAQEPVSVKPKKHSAESETAPLAAQKFTASGS